MSILNLREFKTKSNFKFAHIAYKGIDLKVQYKISNDSFDNEFGTEKRPDRIEIYSVMCDMTDISKMLTQDQVESISQIINGDVAL